MSRQYYEVIRVRKRGRGRRDLFDWARLLGMGAILLFVIGYIVRLYAFAAPASVVYIPLVLR